MADQEIEIFIKRNAGWTQNISIGIQRGDQVLNDLIFESELGRSEEKKFQLAFKANDFLTLDFSTRADQARKANLESQERVVVEIDNCRTSGR